VSTIAAAKPAMKVMGRVLRSVVFMAATRPAVDVAFTEAARCSQ
jgi:hypothetical protein